MDAVELVALASSISLLAGWRLYLVTLVTGVAMKLGWIDLPERLEALDVLANNWVIGIAATGAIAEFFADKIAWVDSAWDAVHSFIRPVGGALLSLAIIDAGDPAWQVASSSWAAARRSSPMPARRAHGRWSTPAPSHFRISPC